jgi:hypothetical protein
MQTRRNILHPIKKETRGIHDKLKAMHGWSRTACEHRYDSPLKRHFPHAFAKRPQEQLYDLSKGPDATSPA